MTSAGARAPAGFFLASGDRALKKRRGLSAGAALAVLAFASGARAQTASDRIEPAPPVAGPDTISDAIAGGHLLLEARARYEFVDQTKTAALRHNGEAHTLRTRIGWETAPLNGFKGLIEFEDVRALGGEHYNSTLNGKTVYPAIADPAVTELNRLQISWTPNKIFSGTVGRQLIVLDDQRFIGAVAWRQDEQTFDAARADVALGKFKITTGWLNRINRVFGEGADWSSDSWIVNGAYNGPDTFKPSGFVYAFDFSNARANSSLTWGARVTGKTEVGDVGLTYAASYAHQSDYASNPASFGLDYWSVEGAATVGIVTLKANFESLEGNGGRGFSTPLATLHAFQGWADVFLTTPANGIEDTNLTLAVKPKIAAVPGLQLMVVAHAFKAQRGGAELGDELDLQVTAPITKRLSGVIKYAAYDGVPGFASRQKFWFGFDFKL